MHISGKGTVFGLLPAPLSVFIDLYKKNGRLEDFVGVCFLSFPSQICNSNEDKFCQINPDATAIIWQHEKCSILGLVRV